MKSEKSFINYLKTSIKELFNNKNKMLFQTKRK